MKNYNETEKSLKRWLKRKVKVTLGMMVAFMITGTVGFALDISSGEYEDKVYGEGVLNITGGSFKNRIFGGSNKESLKNTEVTLSGEDIKLIRVPDVKSGRIIAGGENNGVTETIKLKISNLNNIDYKFQIGAGSEISKDSKNISIEDGDSYVFIENSILQADVRGAGFVYGTGGNLKSGNSEVIIKNSSISGYEDGKNNLWAGQIFGSGVLEGGETFFQNSTVIEVENVEGVTYLKDPSGEITNYAGLRIFGGGQLYGNSKTENTSILTIGSSKIVVNGEETSVASVIGGSLISGTGSRGILETGKTEIVVNNGTIIDYLVGGNYTNWNGYSIIGKYDENGTVKYNDRQYSEGSTNIIINNGNLSEAQLIGGTLVDYAWYYEDKEKVVHDGIVIGDTNITINDGNIGMIIGGGKARYYNDKPQDNNGKPEDDANDVYPITSNVEGNTNIIINNGAINGDIIGGGLAESYQNVSSISKIRGNTNITINGGKIVGDIISGGLAHKEYKNEMNNKDVNATVEGNTSVVITGGIIEGNIYAGGYSNNGTAQVTGDSTIDINGGEIKGSVYGTGLGENSEVLGNSILNIDGYKNSIKNISGFDEINISQATDMKVDNITLAQDEKLTNAGKITLGLGTNDSALLTINGGVAVNNGTIVVKSTQDVASNTDGKFTSAGSIQISDKTVDELKDFDVSSLFTGTGNYSFTGMLKDKDGNGVLTDDDEVIENGDFITDVVNEVGNQHNGEVNIQDGVSIVAGEEAIDTGSVNIYGNVTIKNNLDKGVEIENTPINISGDKHITIGDNTGKADLTITSGVVNGNEGQTAIEFAHKDSSLTLNGTNVTGNIGGESSINGSVNVTDSTINGDINVNELVTGNKDKNAWDFLFRTTTRSRIMLASARVGETEEIPTTIYNGDITVDGGRFGAIDENVIYNGNVTYKGTQGINIGATGENKVSATFNGNVVSDNIKLAGDTTAYYDSNITLTKEDETSTIGTTISGGTNVFEIGENGENALGNTSNKVVADGGVTATGVTITTASGIKLDVSDVEKDMTIDLGEKTQLSNNEVGLTQESDGFYGLNRVEGTGNKYQLSFKQNLASEKGYSSELDGIMNASQVIHGLLNDKGYTTVESRIPLVDRIYAGNLYSETMKVAYDNTKLVEDSILSLNTETKVGEWVANGKAIYDKNEYDRKGTLKDYSSEIETTGLMATLEYGLTDTTSTGIVFAGAKQDITSETGTADGDVFYLGLFANKTLGNNKFTTGLGYQLDKLDATNNILGGGDKYDSSAINAYAQVKHIAKFDGITFEPKVKVGYTYVDQDEVKDGAMKLNSQDMNVFDVKVGLDVSKEISLSSAKLRVLAGVDFTKLYGDIDDKYVGSFYGVSGEKSFDVLGANLAENTINFTLGAEVETEGGFFYNLGATYTMGSDNTENYGANLGIGYRF